MKQYLSELIEEKGKSLDYNLNIDDHIGITFEMLFDFIETMPKYHQSIKNTLVKIDFENGDIFHYLNHLGKGMVKSVGY